MAENKNQSWPSVTGRARTGSGYDPSKISPLGNLQNLRKQKFQGEMALTSQYAAIMQNLGVRSIANQEQLAMTRQTNLQRMAGLYGNYFQEFGGVLNEGALEFLDKHSKINVPTLTAIMAGYEHARASAADRELMALQKQEQLLKEGLAIEQERTALADKRAANDALALTTNLEQARKSYSDYMSGVIADAGGAGATGRRGAGGVTGAGGGSAAGAFQAPVTGGGGTGTVAGGGGTGFVDPSNPQVAALNKMIDDSNTAQTAGQASQLGPLSQQARTDSELITQWSDIPSATGVALGVGAAGRGLNWLGQRNRLGYLDPQNLSKYQTAQNDVSRFARLADDSRGVVLRREAQLNNILSSTSGKYGKYANDIQKLRDYLETNPRARPSASIRNALAKLDRAESTASRLGGRVLDAERLAGEALSSLGGQRALDTANKASFLSKSLGKTLRTIGAPASKLLGRLSLIGTGAEAIARLTDEGAGFVAASAGWVGDRFSDLTGQTTREEALLRGTAGQAFRNRYEYYRDYTRAFQNAVIGSDSGLGLENEDVSQLLGRLSELGWIRESNVLDATNQMYGFLEMQRNNPTAFRQAMEALYQYDPHLDPTTGRMGQEININPLEFFNRAYSNSVYRKQAFIQESKAAQNQQVTDQEIMRDQRIADALARKPKFFAGMAEYLTRVGREAGYDFDEADAAAMMGRLIEMNQAMESGGKFGAVGANTSTGTAKSRHQFMDMTFDQLRKWMLEDDNKAGGIFFNDDERNALRQARTANDLDNEQFGHLLDLMVPYYLMKDNVNIGKFGKGNPNIGSLQALVDLSQMTKDIGISPYLDSSMNALRMAGFGRFKAGKEFDETVSRFNRDWQGPIWSAQFGDRATSNGAYRSRDMYLQDFANNGILLGPYQNKVPANEYLQWVNEYFVVDKDGNITGIKEGANPKHLDKWREENGLARAQKVGVPQQIVRSNNVRLDKGVNFDNLNRTLKQRVNKFADNLYSQYGFGVDVTSGHRTPEDQVRVKKDPNSMRAANPGSSPHQAGLGIDISIRRLEAAFNKSEAAKQKYGGDFNKFVKEEAEAAGLYRFDPVGDKVHFSMIEDDDYKANVDHDLYMKDKAAGKLSDSKRYEKNQGLTLPSLPALRQVQPFSPAQWTDPVVEPVNQGVADFQGLDFLGQYIDPRMVIQQPAYPQTNWQEGMNQLNQQPQQEEGDYGTVYIGSQQMQTFLGWDEQGNPVYQ